MMRIWTIPMKGKGCEVTARGIVLGEASDMCRPLTTDPMDNVLVSENEDKDTPGYEEGIH